MRRNSVRNRDDDGSGSFELLLDTMCNTFGGIVFIALLLTILSQSIDTETQSSIHKNRESDLHQQELLKKIERVKFNLSLKEQRDKLTETILADSYALASAKETISVLEKDIDLLNQEIALSEKHLHREFRLPKLHPVQKSPVFLAIRQAKLYCITNISYAIANVPKSSWGERGYDTSDIFIREYKNRIVIEPLSGRGEVIRDGAEKTGKLHQAVLNINPEKEFILFAVYPDSFAGFNYVKKIFIERGFEYNWVIVNDKLSFVKGAGEIYVQ